ncbi:MAG TPA: efflux RND transporter periplasmic adaptor subunit, partial [Pirellulales bacterium]
MTACDPTNAPAARRFRPRKWVAAIGAGAAVTALAAALWIRGGAATPPSIPAAGTEAKGDHATGHASSGNAPPAEVRFASPRVVESLGIELVRVASQPVSETIACSCRVAFNQNHYIELRARTEGIVRRIGCDVGAACDAHQALAAIESPRLGDLKAAYINAVSQAQQLQYEATRVERMAADQAVPGKMLREAQTALAQQQTTTANAR